MLRELNLGEAMTVTPMMAQYLEIKDAHKDALLFYRMGDFYEMFFEDAVAAAEALDIALTKRGKHSGQDIPMCGVPVHAAEGYFLTLIRKGFRVAVCEQLESPAEAKKRGYKAVVKRGVVRVVTPGTLTEDSLLSARQHNYLAAFAQVRDLSALAWLDMSTGAVQVMITDRARLSAEIARLAPAEIIVSDANYEELAYLEPEFGVAVTEQPRMSFDSAASENRLLSCYYVKSLEAFGQFSRAEISALGGLLSYVELTQKGQLPHLSRPRQETSDAFVHIDAATRRNLELTQSLTGGRAGSLLSVMDRTSTAAGARLLERRLSAPSQKPDVINARLSSVTYYYENQSLARDLQAHLKRIPDLDRAVSRLSLNRGGPRDLGSIRSSLEQGALLYQSLINLADPHPHKNLTVLTECTDLLDALDRTLIAEPPLLARDGGFVAPGVREDLDQARELRDEGRSIIAGLQKTYQEHTGIAALKVKHNNVLGYFVECTATHADKMMSPPLSETFIHRQTTANQVRFTTVQLSDLERRIQSAGADALRIELEEFSQLCALALESAAKLHDVSREIAQIDLAVSLALLAVEENWVKPKIDNSRHFEIIGGRHPVVEASLRNQSGRSFVANDCNLSPDDGTAKAWILTGPNMSGKSTFLRQNALIAILAQMGSYVPATFAHIGCVGQVFSRVGASDDLARGRSTFMVEMVETASILNQSDDKALVILDEIGRGTSTYDGLSIAWATLEHLHDVNRCRVLFATHYHELTQLSERMAGIENAMVTAKEYNGDVIFLHEVKRGAADRSYGVQVARLAGLPPPVIERARAILANLEQGAREGKAAPLAVLDDLPLFAAIPEDSPQVSPDQTALQNALDNLHPDEMSPRDALDALYRLKALSTEPGLS